MGQFEYYYSHAVIVSRVISIKKEAGIIPGAMIYRIKANVNWDEDSNYDKLFHIYFNFYSGDEKNIEVLESLQPNDVIECMGRIMWSHHNTMYNDSESYDIIWEKIERVFKAS